MQLASIHSEAEHNFVKGNVFKDIRKQLMYIYYIGYKAIDFIANASFSTAQSKSMTMLGSVWPSAPQLGSFCLNGWTAHPWTIRSKFSSKEKSVRRRMHRVLSSAPLIQWAT